MFKDDKLGGQLISSLTFNTTQDLNPDITLNLDKVLPRLSDSLSNLTVLLPEE